MDTSETLFDFPCRFPIKVMGRAEDDFAALVVEIISRHAPDLDPAVVTTRPSHGGKWLAVTLIIEARDKSQLDAIYRDLSAHERVVWAL
ncbi:MAG: DUF493 domain-containing protein [Chromatiaceae bacterium]|nr:DUF493 domain-containing protein [Chromatiaceae bacterium]